MPTETETKQNNTTEGESLWRRSTKSSQRDQTGASKDDNVTLDVTTNEPTEQQADADFASLDTQISGKRSALSRHNDVTTKQQTIEAITREETLHHIEMAWRAQQRLVRRCLGLGLLADREAQDADTIQNDGDGKTLSGS